MARGGDSAGVAVVSGPNQYPAPMNRSNEGNQMMHVVVTLYPRDADRCEDARDAGLSETQMRDLADALASSANDWIEQSAPDRARGVTVRWMCGMPPRTLPADLCVVGFRAEAYDTVAATLQRFTAHNREDGATVHVVPLAGEAFDAEVCDLAVDEDDGKWKVQLAPWNQEEGRGDRSKVRTFDIYDEIARFEVI